MRCRSIAMACGLAVVAMGSGATAASAGPITVRMTMGEYYTEVVAYRWSEVHVRAGEDADDLTVRAAPGGVMIRARGARLRLLPVDPDADQDVAKPCRRRSPHAVFCPLAKKSEKAERFTPQVWLFTGPGDDRVRAETGTAMWVYAPLGAGGDVASLRGGGTLWGDAGADRLRLRTRPRLSGSLEGGAGDDVLSGDGELSGGAGADALLGSQRANTLKPGTGWDLVDGGGGADRLAYDGSAPVRVDLSRAWASTVGGTARLRSIEDAVTGTGDDVLIGDGRRNDLDGGAGSNVIYAGGGDDRLAGAVAGGACGSGVDTVRVPENGDLKAYEDYYTGEITPPSAARLTRPLPLDCERAEMDYFGVIRPRPRVVGQHVEFSLVRPSAWRYVLTWELRAGWRPGGRLLGKRELDGRTRRIAIPVNARGRRCIATTSCRVSLTVGVDSARGDAAASILPLLL